MTELRSVAPILVADDLAPSLAFWTDRLGFAVTVTVPEAPPFDFAIVTANGCEIMLQARASVGADLPAIGPAGPALIYLSVPSLQAVIDAIEPQSVIVPRRTTFYGADEIWVREPGGNVVGFAAHAAPPLPDM